MGNIFTLLILALLLPLQAGIMARSFGRNFWLWFVITLPLPVIGNYILLCLGDKEETKQSVHQPLTGKPMRLVVNS
jgi:hypothetical protein